MSDNEKVLFSFRVMKHEDGSIRTESHADPEWREEMEAGGWGPKGWGGFGMRHGFGRRRGYGDRRGWRPDRKRAREMLDWFEHMYDDVYGEDDPKREDD